MKISRSTQGNVMVLEPEGEFSGRAAGAMKTELRNLQEQGTTRIVIELSRVTYIDSSGVSVLIGAHNDLQGAGGGLKLVNLSHAVHGVLESTRLTSFFQVWDSLEQALMVFGESPSALGD